MRWLLQTEHRKPLWVHRVRPVDAWLVPDEVIIGERGFVFTHHDYPPGEGPCAFFVEGRPQPVPGYSWVRVHLDQVNGGELLQQVA